MSWGYRNLPDPKSIGFRGGGVKSCLQLFAYPVICHEHHLDHPEAVHVIYEICRILQSAGQTAFMKQYPDKDFMKIFGKNYI